jgi:hypothetical protein
MGLLGMAFSGEKSGYLDGVFFDAEVVVDSVPGFLGAQKHAAALRFILTPRMESSGERCHFGSGAPM